MIQSIVDMFFWLFNQLSKISFGWSAIVNGLSNWVVLQFTAVIGLAFTFLKFISLAVNNAVSALNDIHGLGDGPGTSNVESILSVVNYILPLEELFALAIVYVSIRASCAVYRFIKSWIPTVS